LLKTFLHFSFDSIGFVVYTAHMKTRARFRKVKQGKMVPLPVQRMKPKTTPIPQVAANGTPAAEVKPEISPTVQAALHGPPASDAKPEATPAVFVVGTHVGPPPPEFLLHEAMGEPDRLMLADYGDTINLLRNEKRFSFREIAQWLQTYGIECDHNSVYREYTRGLSFEEEREEARIAMEEDDER
jgi:hypothetical protein